MVYFYIFALIVFIIDFILTGINFNEPSKSKTMCYLFGLSCLAAAEILTLIYSK